MSSLQMTVYLLSEESGVRAEVVLVSDTTMSCPEETCNEIMTRILLPSVSFVQLISRSSSSVCQYGPRATCYLEIQINLILLGVTSFYATSDAL